MARARKLTLVGAAVALVLGATAGAGGSVVAGRLKPGQSPFSAAAGRDADGGAVGRDGVGDRDVARYRALSGVHEQHRGGRYVRTVQYRVGHAEPRHPGTGQSDRVGVPVDGGLWDRDGDRARARRARFVFPPSAATGVSAALLPPPGLVLFTGDAQVRVKANPPPLASALRVEIDETARTYRVFLGGLPVTVEAIGPIPPPDSPCAGVVSHDWHTVTTEATIGLLMSDPQPLPRDPTRLRRIGPGDPAGRRSASSRVARRWRWKLVDGVSPPPVAVDDTVRVRAGQTLPHRRAEQRHRHGAPGGPSHPADVRARLEGREDGGLPRPVPRLPGPRPRSSPTRRATACGAPLRPR